MVSAPLNHTHGRQELETIYREDPQPKLSAGVVPPPSPFAQSDMTPVIDNQVAGAKRRFRTRERPPEHVDGTTNHVNRAVEYMSTPNNSSQLGSDLCPRCSLPLLHQDLKQTDGNYMFLCQSSSSTTTRGLRSKGSAGTSSLAYSVLDDFSLHDYDTSGFLLPKQSLMGDASCDFLGPVQCLLEEFVGSYCDSLCTLKSNSNPASERDATSTKKVPPYCANCKAYIVHEAEEDEKQDEMLQNLVAWLAASSSTEGDGGDTKISKVAFRPSKGKIEVMRGPKLQPFLDRRDSAGSLSTEGSSRPPIHPRGGNQPYPRTPRSVPSPMGFQDDRYSIDDSSDSQERRRAGGSMRFSRSRSPRRRSYLDLLDDQGNDQVAVATNMVAIATNMAAMPTKSAPVDPSPRVPPSQLPSSGIGIATRSVKPIVLREDPPESIVGVPVIELPPQAFNAPTNASSERPLSPKVAVFTVTSLSDEEAPLSPRSAAPAKVRSPTKAKSSATPMLGKNPTVSSTSIYEHGPQPVKAIQPTLAQTEERVRETVSPVNPPQVQRSRDLVPWPEATPRVASPVRSPRKERRDVQQQVARLQFHEHNQDMATIPRVASPARSPRKERRDVQQQAAARPQRHEHNQDIVVTSIPLVASTVRSPRKERRDAQQQAAARPQRHEHNQDIVVTSMEQPNAQFIDNNPTQEEGQPIFLPMPTFLLPSQEPEIVLSPRQQHPSLNTLNDDSSIGTCTTLKEEEVIIGDYDEKRNIATKAIGRNLMEGFALTQLQCGHCEMPMMERDGVTECVVCPLVSKKAKKRAHSKRMGQAMSTFDSESSPWLSHGAQQHLQDQLNEPVDLPPQVVKHQASPRALEARKSSNDTFDEREPIQGEHIEWEEREYDQAERTSFPDDEDIREVAIYEAEVGSLPSYEDVNDEGSDFKDVNDEGSDFKDDNSEAESENMEMASQEVYRRLLGGWLLTTSKCTRCNAPLMKSTTGEVSCVVCTSNASTATTEFPITGGACFEHPTSPRDSIFSHRRVHGVHSRDESDGSIALSPKTNVSDGIQQRANTVYTPEEDVRLRAVYTPEEDIGFRGRPRPEVESPKSSRPETTKEGLRYLAIPEHLDLDDHAALLSFLAENKNREQASGDAVVHKEQRSRLVSPGSSHRNTSSSHQLMFQSPRNNLQRHSARDAPGGSDDSRPDPSGAAITEVISSNSSSTMHTPIQLVSHGEATKKRESNLQLRVPDFVSREEFITSDANHHKSTEAIMATNSGASGSKTVESLALQEKSFQGRDHNERQHYLTSSKIFRVPTSVSGTGRSGTKSVEFGANDLVLREKSFQGNHDRSDHYLTSSNTFHVPSASEAGRSGTGAVFEVARDESKKHSVRGIDSPASAQNDSDSRMNDSPLLLLAAPSSSLDLPVESPTHEYASRENSAPATSNVPESVHSETSGIFEVVEDHSDLLLRFDGTNRQQSLIRPVGRPPSPRRPMQSRTRDVNIGSREVMPQDDDYVLRHSIKLPVKPKPMCNACKTFLKPDADAEDLVCGNPQCTIFMIPTDSINMFTSAMKETTTAREEIMSGSSDGIGLTLLTTRDIVADSQYSFDRWDLITRTTPSVESPSGRSYRSSSSINKPLSPSTDVFSTSTGGVMSRAGSMESLKSINSDTLDIMLSRMKDTRSQLVQSSNNSPLAAAGEDGDKTEITQLINRLASAAVAIKDLEQHVVDADDLSPQHLLQGRPPTSPRANMSPNARRAADLVDVHWF